MDTKLGHPEVLQFKVTLLRLRPPVWRRILVPARLRLDQLHGLLQAALGWHDAHMHQFSVRSRPKLPTRADLKKARGDFRHLDLGAIRGLRVYSLPEFRVPGALDETTVTLATLVYGPRFRLKYTYDLGDQWTHEITLEKVRPAAQGERYPRLLAGRGACPPEASGGPAGYAALLKAAHDRKHRDHETARKLLGRAADRKFSRAAADRAVRRSGKA